jgi:hypothetical protein
MTSKTHCSKKENKFLLALMGYASGIEINSFQVFLGFLMLKWSWTTCD